MNAECKIYAEYWRTFHLQNCKSLTIHKTGRYKIHFLAQAYVAARKSTC